MTLGVPGNVMAYRTITIALDSAVSKREYAMPGIFWRIIDGTPGAAVTLSLNSPDANTSAAKVGFGWTHASFNRFYLSWAAQSAPI